LSSDQIHSEYSPRPDAISRNRRWSEKALPYVLLTAAPLCWAGNIVLARGVIDIIPPVGFAFWRWTTALVILLPFTWHHVRRDWGRAMQSWKIMALLSVLGISSFNTLLYTAVHTTTAINGSLIQSTMPAVIILAASCLYREKVLGTQLLGVFICIAGAGVIVLRGQWHTLLDLSFVQGDVLMILAVVLYALYSVLLPKRPGIHPLSFLTVTFGLGALGLLPVYIWELSGSGPFAITADVFMSVVYVAVFPSIVAYFCWNRGIELIGPNRAGLFINFIPLFASVLAILFLGEALRSFHILGMLMIFGGMVLFNTARAE
jgi:drug/metabolite transporter (DMT)-like permease